MGNLKKMPQIDLWGKEFNQQGQMDQLRLSRFKCFFHCTRSSNFSYTCPFYCLLLVLVSLFYETLTALAILLFFYFVVTVIWFYFSLKTHPDFKTARALRTPLFDYLILAAVLLSFSWVFTISIHRIWHAFRLATLIPRRFFCAYYFDNKASYL
jgi:hypothetical protein